MLGAIMGDMIGSVYDCNNIKTKKFPIFNIENHMTDDSLLTIAVTRVLLDYIPLQYDQKTIEIIQDKLTDRFENTYRNHIGAGWGSSFIIWCKTPKALKKPYHSFGNGAGMRISPVGWIAKSENEVKILSRIVTEITHNHPEGIKGAEAIAMCIHLALKGNTKNQIKNYVINNYYEEISTLSYQTLVRNYSFDISCQGSVPQAIFCFLISNSLEDAIRTAISIGGDSDTIAAMTGSIAEAFYQKDKLSDFERDFIYYYIDTDIETLLHRFHNKIKSTKFSSLSTGKSI